MFVSRGGIQQLEVLYEQEKSVQIIDKIEYIFNNFTDRNDEDIDN